MEELSHLVSALQDSKPADRQDMQDWFSSAHKIACLLFVLDEMYINYYFFGLISQNKDGFDSVKAKVCIVQKKINQKQVQSESASKLQILIINPILL